MNETVGFLAGRMGWSFLYFRGLVFSAPQKLSK
jgi:hypothetical protein